MRHVLEGIGDLDNEEFVIESKPKIQKLRNLALVSDSASIENILKEKEEKEQQLTKFKTKIPQQTIKWKRAIKNRI